MRKVRAVGGALQPVPGAPLAARGARDPKSPVVDTDYVHHWPTNEITLPINCLELASNVVYRLSLALIHKNR